MIGVSTVWGGLGFVALVAAVRVGVIFAGGFVLGGVAARELGAGPGRVTMATGVMVVAFLGRGVKRGIPENNTISRTCVPRDNKIAVPYLRMNS